MTKKVTKYIPKKITSAADALQRHKTLESYWSSESRLTQLIIIYIAELLEKLVKQRSTNRKTNAYQKHIIRECALGKTIQEAAQSWREKQNEQ